jgi:toxin ParE1/3/4
VAWYDERREGLGTEFAAEVEKTIGRISREPLAFQLIENGLRQALIRRFPFMILFIDTDDQIEVVAVFHTSRNPQVWKSRME